MPVMAISSRDSSRRTRVVKSTMRPTINVATPLRTAPDCAHESASFTHPAQRMRPSTGRRLVLKLAMQCRVYKICKRFFRSVFQSCSGVKTKWMHKHEKCSKSYDLLHFWWGKVDSNHRRHSQQIYSLSPLATREFPHIQLCKSGLPGAGRRTRTPGLLITNQLLYQLSYTSISRAWWLYRTTRKMSRSIFI